MLKRKIDYLGLLMLVIAIWIVYFNFVYYSESIRYYKEMNMTYTNYTLTYQLAIEKYNDCINESKRLDKYYESGCEAYRMYNLNISEDAFGIRGVYYDPNFYCVWTKNQNLNDTIYTQQHETCHAMVSQDYEHFCK